jgi:hypothetical protein
MLTLEEDLKKSQMICIFYLGHGFLGFVLPDDCDEKITKIKW